MTKSKLTGAFILILLIGCAEQKSSDLKSYDLQTELNDSTIVQPQLYEIEEPFNPANFSLQSNKGGLAINPLTPASDYSLFYYQHEDTNRCCSQMNGLMKSGRGPGESGALSNGTRTPDGDTLVYYSMNTTRFYHFDQDLNLIKNPVVDPRDIFVTDNFAYADGKYYTEDTFSDDEKILRIYDSNADTTKNLLDYRIPHGYQPAARNSIASIVSIPGHTLVAIVGEKEILILDESDQLAGKVILGENDPLPEPYKPVSNNEVESSLQHIYKMEYLDGMIFVMMKSGIIVINNQFKFIDRLVFYDGNDEQLLISDFTVNNELLYLRQGLSSLYRANYSKIRNILSKN